MWCLSLILILSVLQSSSLHSIKKYGFVDGDIIIGVLLPIHEQPLLGIDRIPECGEIRDEYGMQRVEVLLKTVKEINDNPNILNKVKLGLEIRDTCWDIPIALEQCLDIIKNIINQRKIYSKSIGNDTQDLCYAANNKQKAITALIGPASSSITIEVQNLLQLFKIPQIGYSATSIDLSRKDYKYFLRVVPSDRVQVKVLVELIRYFKWNFISTVNTIGNYGTQGIKELTSQLKDHNICFDQKLEVGDKDDMWKFRQIVSSLFFGERAKVVICFCQGETVKKILKAMMELNLLNKGFMIIGTDGWADRADVLGSLLTMESKKRELSEAALGAITIRLHSKPVPKFDNYFRSKTYKNAEGNPWFQEFWEQKFKCNIGISSTNKYSQMCSGNESLLNQQDYVQDSKLGFVVKSIMTVAYGLHRLFKHEKLFRQNEYSGFIDINGTRLLNEMLQVSFKSYDGEIISFDENGDPLGRYEIMNYQFSYDEETHQNIYKYQTVGSWINNSLSINEPIQWPRNKKFPNSSVKSICSEPCKSGFIRNYIGEKYCCWTCRQCKKREYVNNTDIYKDVCVECPQGFRPLKNRSGCRETPLFFIQWSDLSSIIAIVFSCVGILITIVITGIFIKYHDTPIVKSSTRELMYIILAGIMLSYLTTFPLLSKPTLITCILTRVIPGISFSLIFGSLVTKTNRIFRILAISKKKISLHAGRFLTTSAQLVIVLILNMLEIIVIISMLWKEPPYPLMDYSVWNKTFLLCNVSPYSLFIPLGFDAVLICFCTWYAFRTRNLPENFNEAKFIGFTMYTTCIIWIGFVVIYFSTDIKIVSLCFAMSLTATISLILLFMPKVFIMLFEPEKNDRSAFTTAKDIRCHIGLGTNTKTLSQSSSSLQKLKFHVDSMPCSKDTYSRNESYANATSLKSVFCLQNSNNGLFQSQTNLMKETKVTQTDLSKIMRHFFELSHGLNGNNEELNMTQITLLQILKENWNKNHIPQINIPDRVKERVLCLQETFMDED